MDPIIQKSLRAAKAGHEAILAGFGLERYVVYGPACGAFGRQWEDRLTMTGKGVGQFHNVRSISDGSGDAAGLFQGKLEPDDLKEVIELVEQVGLLDEAPFQIEPKDMSIRMTIIVGGMQVVKYVGLNEPERIAKLEPLFRRLRKVELALRENPVRTVRVDMTLPAQAAVGMQTIPVTLRFVNDGGESYWMQHPRMLNNGAYYDRATLTYGYRPPVEPGIAPPPIEVMESALLPETEAGLQMIWMAAGGAQEIRMRADVNFHQSGKFLARAVYSNYTGEETVGGVPRLRGCVFSAEHAIIVSG
ncbi:MAG: hypothetical protein ACKV2U_16680 [Bryobacteraceae bacterium]